jgi:hypothetical protein
VRVCHLVTAEVMVVSGDGAYTVFGPEPLDEDPRGGEITDMR